MERRRNITGGLVLILVGAFFIFWQFAPDNITGWFDRYFDWPYYVIGSGLFLLLVSLVSGVGGLAVPGTIVSGIGGILYYQNLTGDWASWGYIWVFIPGLVGLGIVIGSFISRDMRHERRTGFSMFFIATLIGLALWAVFHTGVVGTSMVWAVVLILLGLYVLVSGLLRKNR